LSDVIVEAMPPPPLFTERRAHVILANRANEAGYSAREMLTIPAKLLLPGDLRGIVVGLLAQRFEAVAGPATRRLLDEPSPAAGMGDAEQRMAALVESAEDAILTDSLDGIIRSWNRAAERLLGYSAAQIIGQPVTRLLPEDRCDEEEMILDRIRRGQRVAHFETIRRRRDGSLVDVSLSISAIRDRSGAYLGASRIMRDVTERRRSEADLRRRNTELAQLNEDLDDFVYCASHDLRSPLTAVNAVVQWMLEDDHSLSPESHGRLALIRNRIARMQRLLQDIQDYARSGHNAETSGPMMTAAELVMDVVELSHVPAGFAVDCHPSLHRVDVRRVPLEQIFHNLIGNAIKHHDRPVGWVMVSVVSNLRCLRFSVKDDGPGVPAEYSESIFEMFKTLKPRDEVEGSGLGLAMVRKIVARLGGKCGVESAGERGANFWFDWPHSKAQLPNPKVP
jgi:PAS domain S-box-containing protein